MAENSIKSRIVVTALMAGLLFGAAEVRADDWLGEDKVLHWAVSGAIGAGVHTTLWLANDEPLPLRLALSVGVSLLPGLAKEIYDSGQPGNSFSGADMLFNTLGVITGVGLALGVELLVARLRQGEGEVALGWGGSSLWLRGRF